MVEVAAVVAAFDDSVSVGGIGTVNDVVVVTAAGLAVGGISVVDVGAAANYSDIVKVAVAIAGLGGVDKGGRTGASL